VERSGERDDRPGQEGPEHAHGAHGRQPSSRPARRDCRTRDRWLVYLAAATTGLRWGQLKGLEWEHARLEADPPHLDLRARLCKNGEPSIVWLTAELAGALRDARGVRYRFTPNVGSVPETRVFRSVPKTTSFDRDLRAAGLDKGGGDRGTFSFHSLRHFASNRMAWVGFSTTERQRQNQHLTEAMTEKIYTDPENIELGRKVLSMPDLLASGPTPGVMVAGETSHIDLTDLAGTAEMSPAKPMPTTPSIHDSKAPAHAAGVVLADFDGTRAGTSVPGRWVSPSGESGRQDSNLSPRSTGRGPRGRSGGVAHGRDAEGREPLTDPLTLAIESAEAALRVVRALSDRRPSHDDDHPHPRAPGRDARPS